MRISRFVRYTVPFVPSIYIQHILQQVRNGSFKYNVICSFGIRLELHCFENLQLHTLFILKSTEQIANTASHRFAPSFHVQNAFGCVFVVLNVGTKPYPRIIGILALNVSCYSFYNNFATSRHCLTSDYPVQF